MSAVGFTLIVALGLLGCASAFAAPAVETLDACFIPDTPFPQFEQFWSESGQDEKPPARPLGGYVHVYIRNNGDEPFSVGDVLLEGISLKRAIAYSDQRKFKHVARAASIYFSDLSTTDRDKLIAAGEPVWWKAEPAVCKPGEVAAVTVRLRRPFGSKPPKLAIKLAGGAVVDVPQLAGGTQPKLVGSGFAPGLKEVYLYFQGGQPGKSPSKIVMDGRDVTNLCSIGRDPNLDIAPVVCRLSSPLARASLHCFQGVYDDGSKATAAFRAWDDDLFYGVWGARPGKENEIEIGRSFVRELAEHNVNGHMVSVGSEAVRVFMISEEGRKMLDSLGIRRVVGDRGKTETPAAYYLADEPDTADFKVTGVPAHAKIGCIAQGLLQRAYELRESDPAIPNMTNLDQTFKPDNWYTYGQLPDIFAADPYYQSRLAEVYRTRPHLLPIYTKATFIEAVASICQSACAPKPLHIILNSVQSVRGDWKFRFATPEEKRIEVYYALGSGAKAISYWWFVPLSGKGTGANGLGANTPEAAALWREIGLLGAEARTAGPIITTSCPTNLSIEAPGRLWVRSLVAGLDTIVILCVNDDYANDRLGTVFRPVEKAKVSVSLPAWLDSKSVFEITYAGTQDLASERAGSKINLDLGTVNVSRLVVITSEVGLRERLQKLYAGKFAANVAKLTSSR